MLLRNWLLSISILLLSCQQTTTPAIETSVGVYHIKTVRHNNGWGYEIKQEEKTIIRQLSIPSIGGKQVFSTKEDAQKVGLLMAQKLNKKIFPPSINKHELDSLQVSYAMP
jgi:hypothetical protein